MNSKNIDATTKVRVLADFMHGDVQRRANDVVELNKEELYTYRKQVDADSAAVAYAERYQKWLNRPIVKDDVFE